MAKSCELGIELSYKKNGSLFKVQNEITCPIWGTSVKTGNAIIAHDFRRTLWKPKIFMMKNSKLAYFQFNVPYRKNEFLQTLAQRVHIESRLPNVDESFQTSGDTSKACHLLIYEGNHICRFPRWSNQQWIRLLKSNNLLLKETPSSIEDFAAYIQRGQASTRDSIMQHLVQFNKNQNTIQELK